MSVDVALGKTTIACAVFSNGGVELRTGVSTLVGVLNCAEVAIDVALLVKFSTAGKLLLQAVRQANRQIEPRTKALWRFELL